MLQQTATTFTSRVVDRALRPLSKVHPGEGVIAALMLVTVFLLLCSYYMLKTAREGLILSSGSLGLRGDELKTYATGAMAVFLGAIVPLYGRVANWLPRIKLINLSYAIVIVSLAVFWVLGHAGVEVSIPFYVWLGLVSLFLVAQFWSYANDIYTEEQGRRLFANIALGGSVGAMVGPRLATLADTFVLMPVAAALLFASVVILNVIERLDHVHPQHIVEAPIGGPGGFTLVMRDRYLLLIAIMLLVVNLVNTTGEYILANAVRERAEAVTANVVEQRELIKAFYGSFFSWVNVIAFVLQAFVVSRVIHWFGIRRALFVMPMIVFGAYTLIGVAGGLALMRAVKLVENSTDYSLQNTVRQTLFLPVSRAAKYKAKAAIDTFFVRAGDTFSAVLVGLWIHQVGLGRRALAFVNVGLVLVWLAMCIGIAREHRKLRTLSFSEEDA